MRFQVNLVTDLAISVEIATFHSGVFAKDYAEMLSVQMEGNSLISWIEVQEIVGKEVVETISILVR